MGFHHVPDRSRSIAQGGLDQQLLRQTVQCGECRALAVVSSGRAQAGNLVPLITLITLEHDRPTAFATQVAIRSRVKGVATPANRRHARQRRAHVSARVQYRVRGNSKSEWALVMLHAPPRGVHGNQARRAGRVKYHARAAHREHVRQARASR